MEAKDNIRLKGSVLIEVKDLHGTILETRNIDNLVVTRGKALVTYLLGALNTSVKPDYMAVGTDATAPVAANTLLGAELYRETINTYTALTTTTTDDSIQYVMTIGPAELVAGALTEAGLFGSIVGFVASGVANTGYLLSRVTYPVINKTALISVTYTWKIQQV